MNFIEAYEGDSDWNLLPGLWMDSENLITDKTKVIKPEDFLNKLEEAVAAVKHVPRLDSMCNNLVAKMPVGSGMQNCFNLPLNGVVSTLFSKLTKPFHMVKAKVRDIDVVFFIEDGSSVYAESDQFSNIEPSQRASKNTVVSNAVCVVMNESELVIDHVIGMNLVSNVHACFHQMQNSIVLFDEGMTSWNSEGEIGAYVVRDSLLRNTSTDICVMDRVITDTVTDNVLLKGWNLMLNQSFLRATTLQIYWAARESNIKTTTVTGMNAENCELKFQTNYRGHQGGFSSDRVPLRNLKFTWTAGRVEQGKVINPFIFLTSQLDYGQYTHGAVTFSFVRAEGLEPKTFSLLYSINSRYGMTSGQGMVSSTQESWEIVQELTNSFMESPVMWREPNEKEPKSFDDLSEVDKSMLMLFTELLCDRIELIKTSESLNNIKG